MTGFYKDYADSSDTHQNSAEASADAAEVSANEAAASAAAAQDLEVASASFDTADGTLTLTKANSGTVTTDLDGRYAELTGGASFSGGNFSVDGHTPDTLFIERHTSRVGIRTNDPHSVLHVEGDVKVRSHSPSIKIEDTDAGTTDYSINNVNGEFSIREQGLTQGTDIRIEIEDTGAVNINPHYDSGSFNVNGDSTVSGDSTFKESVIFQKGNFNSYPSIHHRIVEYPNATSINGLHIDGEDRLELKSDSMLNVTCNGDLLRLYGSGGHKFLEGKLDSDGHKTTILYHGINSPSLKTVSDGILVDSKVEAELFKGDLEGAVHFKGAVASGATLTKGDVVYVSGHSGQKTEVDLADASDSNKMPAFGIVAADPVGVNVDVVTFGTLKSINTSTYTDGDELYVDTTAGGLTATAPSGEGNLVQKIAKVVRAANSGNIKVMGAGRTNATPNLNSGNFFLGDSNNQAVTTNFTTAVSAAETSHTDVLVDSDFNSNGFMKRTGVGTYAVDSNTYLTSEANNLTTAVTWADVPDANITEGSVTQHQAAINTGVSITESQISDFGTYLTTHQDISGKANLSGADFTGNVTSTGTLATGGYTLSSTDGTNGQALVTDGSGNVSFGDVTGTVDVSGKADLSGADFTGDVSVAGTFNTNNIESTIDSVDYPVYSTSLDGSNAIATLGGTSTGDKVHTLEMRPAAGGVRMHWHQGGLYDGIAGTSDTTDTLRFHTTDRGIHIGDDSVGTYTAGDNQNNADVDFGMLVGRSSTNIGTNNFGFGHGLSFNSSDIASCLGSGTSIIFQNKTQSSIGMGADVTVGEYNTPIGDPTRKAIFAGGNVVTGSGEYSFTWAKGDYGGGGSNGLVRYSASNLGTGCVLFGYQTKILSDCNYSFNGGSRGLSGDYKHQRLNDCDYTISWGFQNETDRSNSTAVFGQGNDVADSSTTIVAGLNNTVEDSKYASVTGFGNASYCYGGVIGGQSNIVGKDVVDNTDGKYSACFGFDNLVESDGNFVSGYENNTLGHSSACIGRGLKTPLFEPNSGGDYIWDDYSITVGAFNDEAHKYTTNTLGSSWVEDHRFVVGTGTASNAKDNGFIVAVPDSGFSGIIMPNLASSPSYTDDIAAVTGGVPVGGLYHTNGIVKVRRS